MEHRIIRVEEGSIAEELEIGAGDLLISVNGEEIRDVFDFRTLTYDEEVVLLIRKPNGEEWELEIEKEVYEDLGLVFENDLMSDYQNCSNACIFCFIDQMPPGMRDTLYFKDDDSRLSFLQGNYITLTNMKEEDVERIIRYHLEPMNISVHTTEPELRCAMLHNRFAGKVLSYLDRFYEAGLHMNAQIVLCKDYNDREHLDRTLRDLYCYVPVLQSLSVVPVGLTKYREGLAELQPLSKEDAEITIDIVEKWQKKAFEECGIHYVHASDELYILAGREFPEEERYDGYLQLENGVGMARLMFTEAAALIKKLKKKPPKYDGHVISMATGMLALPLLTRVKEMVLEAFPDRKIEIHGIVNDFFGHNVTVAGLVTGQDLTAQLKGKINGDLLFIPNVMLKSGEEIFLDDMTVTQVRQELGVKIGVLKSGGEATVRAMCGETGEEICDLTHGKYEL